MAKRAFVFSIILCLILFPTRIAGASAVSLFALDSAVANAAVLSPYASYSNLEHPSDITTDSSSLYVSDSYGVYKYDFMGKYLSGNATPLTKISAFNYSLLFGIGGGKIHVFDTQSSFTSVYDTAADAIDIAAVPSGSYASTLGRVFLADSQGALTIYNFRIEDGMGAIALPRPGLAYLTITPYTVINTGLSGIKAISPATINGASCLLISAQDNMPGSSLNALYLFNYEGVLLSSIRREQAAAIDICSYEDTIFYTTRTGIFSLSGQSPFSTLSAAALKTDTTLSGGKLVAPAAVSAQGASVFVLDNVYSAVHRYSRDLTFNHNIFAGGGSDPGRFLAPTGAAVFEDKLYVADSANNRVQVLSETSSEIIEGFLSPADIEVSSGGVIYVADSNSTRITIITGTKRETISVSGLTDIKISSDGFLYYSTDTALYKYSGNKSTLIAALPGIKAFAPNLRETGFIALSDLGMYTILEHGYTGKLLDITADDICIDYDRNVFLLSDNTITKYIPSGGSYIIDKVLTVSSPNITETPGILCSMTLNLNPSAFLSIGSMILCDSTKNILRVLTKDQTDAVVFDFTENFKHSPDYGTPDALDTVSVRPVSEGTSIFLYPSSSYPSGTMTKAGDTVIILNSDIIGFDIFVYCLYTVSGEVSFDGDIIKDTVIAGYVYRSALAAQPIYTPFLFSSGRVLNNNSYLYKYPSLYSQKISDQIGNPVSLQQGDTITTKDFAYPYSDNAKASWVAIDYEGRTAYINVLNVSSKNYEPIFSPEKNNASIKTESGTPVYLYSLVDGNYVKLDEAPLVNGQQIRVPSRFDSQQEYTKIIIYNDDLGMIECYIRTEFIRYNSFSIIQVIAAAIMLVTALTALVLFLYKHFYNKRAR